MRGRGASRFGGFAVVAAVALACLQAASPAGAEAGGPQRGAHRGTLHGATRSFPDYLDPQLSYTSEGSTAMYDTYIPLLTYRHAGGRAGSEVVPGLAKSLPEVSHRGTTYTLFLRHGLKYSDGTHVKASDFRFAVERMFKLHSGGAPLYADIVGVKQFRKGQRDGISGIVTNDKTGKIVIHLIKPRSAFTTELALIFAAPVPPTTPLRNQSFDPPPATGPFVITRPSWDGWSYARNPAWKGNARRMPRLPSPHVDRIEIEVIRDASRLVKQVEGGKIDWVFGFLPADEDARLARGHGGARLLVEPALSTYYFWMNTTKPPFDDLRVREAVNYAVDPTALRRIYGGELVSTHQILPPAMPCYEEFDLFPHDIVKARELIAEANPTDREITVWSPSEAPNPTAAAYYRDRLRELGFNAHLKVLNAGNYFFAVSNPSMPDLDTGWSNWFADYPHASDFFDPLLAGSAARSLYNGNFSQIDIPSLNAALSKVNDMKLGPAQERRYAALDRSFMKQAPWVPYGNGTLSTVVSKALNPDKVILNPAIGPDLASLQFK